MVARNLILYLKNSLFHFRRIIELLVARINLLDQEPKEFFIILQ